MIWRTVRPLTIWNPWHELESLSNHLGRILGGENNMSKDNSTELATAENAARPLPTYNPKVSVWENDEAVFLTVEMPGVSEKGVDIDLQGNTLTLSGIMEVALPEGFEKQCQAPLKRKYERQFNLGESINHDEIKAAMKDGVLRLTLPKIKTTTSRRIEVKAD
jgi:HSP20 family protein